MSAPTKSVILTGLEASLTGRLLEASFVQKDGKDLVTKQGSRIAKYVVTSREGTFYLTRWASQDLVLPTIVEGQEPIVRCDVQVSRRNFGTEDKRRWGFELFTDRVEVIEVPKDAQVI